MIYHVHFDWNPETAQAAATVDVPGDFVPNVGAHLRGYENKRGLEYAFATLQPAAGASAADYRTTVQALERVGRTAVQHAQARIHVTWDD